MEEMTRERALELLRGGEEGVAEGSVRSANGNRGRPPLSSFRELPGSHALEYHLNFDVRLDGDQTHFLKEDAFVGC